LMTGEWPQYEIDHVDGDPSNNRWLNLREASRSENMCNVTTRSDNKTKEPSVIWQKNAQKWRVRIRLHGKARHIGYFDDFELAALAAHEARNKYHGEFSANHRLSKAS